MQIPKKGFAGFKQYWKKDLSAGFVVSLIALPLCLALAIASGAPPIAGIIAAFVGAIIISIFGGSHVTITGPGNGLAVATFATVELLGNGDLTVGWTYTMAAIVMSGVVLFVLGLLRFGSLSDFFPSVAVEGMLGAIGLIIMARQLHIMLGYIPEDDSTLELLETVPNTVQWLLDGGSLFEAGIGLGSLLIMASYSLIRAKWLHIVPAPMWVVVLSILLSYGVVWLGIPNAISTEMTIAIPDDLLNTYVPPNFSMLFTSNFWVAVITLTLIASIESLLSIKGIERLDFYKRKANVNKDLRAHGIATSLSGLLGGLNVVTVIARSSVNVNNGAQTRYSNLFHGLILALVIFFLEDLVSMIPLPALAAILVYTGYRLISPSTIKRIASLGWEATTIYALTFIITVSKGIIPGIVSGIFITVLLQLITTRRPGLILRNLFFPNTLMYAEENGTYLLSVQKYANFLNFIRIKNQLDSIPTGSQVIVDLSLCEFVDNSVMEHLHNYHELHVQKGGAVEIVGLDNLRASSNHPFAPWLPIVGQNLSKKSRVLTKRQKSISLYAQEIGFAFSIQPDIDLSRLRKFAFFETKRIDRIRNAMMGMVGSTDLKLLDVDYHLGELVTLQSLHSTFIKLNFQFNIPEFLLHEEDFLDRIASAAGLHDINFEEHADFSHRFFLKGREQSAVRAFFNPELIRFFEENPSFTIESRYNRLLIFDKERLAGINEVKLMVSFASRLAELIEDLQKRRSHARIKVTH